uniref:CS domain-containing protein n=1 Tax=Chromera velia CCMP2878 TaxID=1169474 RepID=A0A0G4FQ12_9ALVE|eukprot:Cvel_18098.t1-p1 / transcript=Cvel_18098.t1 / gene=Cvel_18098 / organism=Chromera_velia_CCMP2878 / gene_product=hypothetical protein / transcript_product=hypothetical protein / location=Cvel_scaffold1483:27123-33739(+) / protein_length=975 / sequence_SO=supercontig / SO=protein_coding / is_pseudo=false
MQISFSLAFVALCACPAAAFFTRLPTNDLSLGSRSLRRRSHAVIPSRQLVMSTETAEGSGGAGGTVLKKGMRQRKSSGSTSAVVANSQTPPQPKTDASSPPRRLSVPQKIYVLLGQSSDSLEIERLLASHDLTGQVFQLIRLEEMEAVLQAGPSQEYFPLISQLADALKGASLSLEECRGKVVAILPDGRVLPDVMDNPLDLMFEFQYQRSYTSLKQPVPAVVLRNAEMIRQAQSKKELVEGVAKRLQEDGFAVIDRFINAKTCEELNELIGSGRAREGEEENESLMKAASRVTSLLEKARCVMQTGQVGDCCEELSDDTQRKPSQAEKGTSFRVESQTAWGWTGRRQAKETPVLPEEASTEDPNQLVALLYPFAWWQETDGYLLRVERLQPPEDGSPLPPPAVIHPLGGRLVLARASGDFKVSHLPYFRDFKALVFESPPSKAPGDENLDQTETVSVSETDETGAAGTGGAEDAKAISLESTAVSLPAAATAKEPSTVMRSGSGKGPGNRLSMGAALRSLWNGGGRAGGATALAAEARGTSAGSSPEGDGGVSTLEGKTQRGRRCGTDGGRYDVELGTDLPASSVFEGSPEIHQRAAEIAEMMRNSPAAYKNRYSSMSNEEFVRKIKSGEIGGNLMKELGVDFNQIEKGIKQRLNEEDDFRLMNKLPRDEPAGGSGGQEEKKKGGKGADTSASAELLEELKREISGNSPGGELDEAAFEKAKASIDTMISALSTGQASLEDLVSTVESLPGEGGEGEAPTDLTPEQLGQLRRHELDKMLADRDPTSEVGQMREELKKSGFSDRELEAMGEVAKNLPQNILENLPSLGDDASDEDRAKAGLMIKQMLMEMNFKKPELKTEVLTQMADQSGKRRVSRFMWKESEQWVEIFLPVERETKSKEINLVATGRSLRVAVNGADLIQGVMEGRVKGDDAYWVFNDDPQFSGGNGQRALQIFLPKKYPDDKIWNKLFEDRIV